MNKINLFIKNPYVIVFLFSICSAMPSVIFGNLGFYGDDFNMFDSLESFGFLGSIREWQDAYGLFYRPVGITFLLSAYAVLGDSSSWMYSLSFFLYISLSILIYKVSLKYFKDVNLSLFITIFFSAFPLNAAAFLQLSSLYMILTSILFLVLLDRLAELKNNDSFLSYLGIFLIWLLALFSYEQITGLIIIILSIFFIKSNFNDGNETKNFLFQLVAFALVTLIFMALYFSSSGNTKVKTLESLNDQSSGQLVSSDAGMTYAQKSNTFHSSRSEAILDKIDRTSDFLFENTLYATNKILDSGLTALALCFFLVITVYVILSLNVRGPPRKLSGLYSLVGFVWIAVTLAPFFLYKSVHIPPYVLLLPAIGLSLLAYGLFWLLWPTRFVSAPERVFKVYIVFIFLFFHINQYGLYFGIKEELSFWEEISYKYNNKLDLTNIKPRENNHIFWAEKLYGVRHFQNLTGVSFKSYKLVYDEESHFLSVIKKDDK